MLRKALFALVASASLSWAAHATDRQIVVEGVTKEFTEVGKKVALVIGNSNYISSTRLINPGNDARGMAEVLEERGFGLTGGGPLFDLDRSGFTSAVRQFGRDAVGADVAYFYYSGHGIQVGGTNYLVPIDAELVRPADADLELLNADLILDQLEAAGVRLKLVIIDACRNNPFLDTGTKGLARGLAQMDAPTGTLISFSTSPGALAEDGPAGGNSPYALAVINNIKKPGQNMMTLWNEVSWEVLDSTKERQRPWITFSAIRDGFFFTPPGPLNVFSEPDIANAQTLKPPPKPVQVASLVTPVMLQGGQEVSSNTDTFTLISKARGFLSKSDYAAAHDLLDQAIEDDPEIAIAWSFKGFAYLMQAKDRVQRVRQTGGWTGEDNEPHWESVKPLFKAATDALDRAIKLDPVYQPARRHRGNTVIAVNTVLVERGKLKGRAAQDQVLNAVKDLQVAATLDPASKTAAASLGIAYALGGSYEAALQSFNAATALDPKYATPYEGRCAVYAQLGQLQRAKAEAAKAGELADSLSKTKCAKRGVAALRK